jgi:hypothetical protein
MALLAVDDTGSGEPLVLVHGGATTREIWTGYDLSFPHTAGDNARSADRVEHSRPTAGGVRG